MLHGVPHTGVGLGSIRSELFFGITEAVVGAITRTYSTFTCDAVVVVKAIAFARLGKTWEVEGFISTLLGVEVKAWDAQSADVRVGNRNACRNESTFRMQTGFMWSGRNIVSTFRLQDPLLEHSTDGWASLAAVATATQAADFGQVRSEQSCSVQAGSPLDRT